MCRWSAAHGREAQRVTPKRASIAKISMPRLFGVVARERLFARLDENRGRPLTAICRQSVPATALPCSSSAEVGYMDEMTVYVVRVYRRDAVGMDGVVESVASGEQVPFHTTEELWRALYQLPSPRRQVPANESGEEDQQ
jgi:hypothetical protein